MSAELMDLQSPVSNPLDLAEELALHHEWFFDRLGDDELVAEVVGQHGAYRLYFTFDPKTPAIQFSCQFDLGFPDYRVSALYEVLSQLNTRQWLGHFEAEPAEKAIFFRHTLLLNSFTVMELQHFEELVETALQACDRAFPALHYAIWGGKPAAEAVSLAWFDTVGNA